MYVSLHSCVCVCIVFACAWRRTSFSKAAQACAGKVAARVLRGVEALCFVCVGVLGWCGCCVGVGVRVCVRERACVRADMGVCVCVCQCSRVCGWVVFSLTLHSKYREHGKRKEKERYALAHTTMLLALLYGVLV